MNKNLLLLVSFDIIAFLSKGDLTSSGQQFLIQSIQYTWYTYDVYDKNIDKMIKNVNWEGAKTKLAR